MRPAASSSRPALGRTTRRLARVVAQAVLPDSVVVWRGPRHRRRVALTFDDGPSEMTEAYLRVLDRYGVRATFFLVGELCAARPDLVIEIAARGHEVAGHGYTHRPFPGLCAADLLENELVRTAELLPKGSLQKRPFVRPPHGEVSLQSLAACARAGFTTVLWSFDSGDWCTDRAHDVARTFREHSPKPGEILLMHEGQAWTLGALPAVLEQLLEVGHEPVTVGQLLAS